MDKQESILSGVNDLIDQWCGLAHRTDCGTRSPKYANKTAAILLSDNDHSRSVPAQGDILGSMYDRIESNWRLGGCRNPSRNTWVLRQRTAPTNAEKKPEETLERVMAQALGETWSNQLATCSGLIRGRQEGRRSVDLVHDLGGNSYEFIELKYKNGDRGRFGSNNPLHATWEIVCYGLLYVLARRRLDIEGEKPVLSAHEIRLVVLAPSGYYRYKKNKVYRQFDLHWLERTINQSLGSLCKGIGVRLTFRFEQFTEDFDRLYKPLDRNSSLRAFGRPGFDFREPVYRSR